MKTPWKRSGIAILLISAFVATDAAAQREPETHFGLWLGGGLGGGWREGVAGPAGYFRIGTTPSDKLLVGAEVIAWVKPEDLIPNKKQINIMASMLFYPFYPNTTFGSEFFFRAGAGLAIQEAALGSFSDQKGFGTAFGIGYDIRIDPNIFITPNFDVLVQRISGETTTAILFTIGLAGH